MRCAFSAAPLPPGRLTACLPSGCLRHPGHYPSRQPLFNITQKVAIENQIVTDLLLLFSYSTPAFLMLNA